MTRPVAVGLAFIFVLSAGVAPAVAAGDTTGPRLVTPDGFTQTTFSLEVYENGTTQWTFEYSRPLANSSEREEFRAFAEDFERNETAIYRNFVDRSRSLVAAGSNATDREMSASSFDRAAYVDETSLAEPGVVELSFHWSNFAVLEGDSVRVGDVFEGGIVVGANQRIVFETGPALRFTSAEPNSYTSSGDTIASSDTVTWVGEHRFTDNRPRVEFERVSAGDGPSATTGSQTSLGDTARSSGDMLLLVGLFVVVVGLVGAAVWQSGAFGQGGRLTEDGAAAAAAAADAESGADEANVAPIEDELLSDSDRVIKLLEANDGRMKQVKIVEQTEWSKSKVSMLLSEMEEEGDISKLRVGRENIISLAGHEPDAAGSPFEDEE